MTSGSGPTPSSADLVLYSSVLVFWPLHGDEILDMGDARGHWDGDTLVVESTNFRDSSTYQNANADRLRLVERFTRTGPSTVRWEVTVDDPTTWTKSWTFSMPLTQDDSQPFQAYESHEGNYGVANILSATRAEEKNGAAQKK